MNYRNILRRAGTCLAPSLFILCATLSPCIAQSDIAIVASPLPPALVEIGTPVQITLTVRNNGPQQSQAFAAQFQIVNIANDSTVFAGTIAVASLQPNTQGDFSSAQSWTADALGSYALDAFAEVPNDPAPTNNQIVRTLQVVPISLGRAVNILRATAIVPDTRRDSIEAYHLHPPMLPSDSLLRAGDVVAPFDSAFTISITEPTYLFFIDDHPGEFFTHPCRIVTVSGITGAITTSQAQAWPVVNEQAVTWGPRCTPNFDLVHGNSVACVPKTNPYTAGATSNTADWALATSGVARDDVEESVIDQDICRWKERINGTASGPHVTGDNIEVERGAENRGLTKKEFCDLIDGYKGKACAKFFWKHVGHGTEKGLVFWDERHRKEIVLSYHDIACKLYDAGIREVCLEITACHSGGIIEELAKKEIKGVVITSSSKQRTTPYDGDGSGTPWERALDSCSKDQAADLNRDGHIDLCELYAWVKVKGVPAANRPNPQIMKLGDTVQFVSARLSNVSVQRRDWGGSYIQQICVKLKVKEGDSQKDSTYYSYTLYIENTSDKRITDTKTYRIVVTCDAPKGKKTKVTIVEEYRPDIAPHQKICLSNIPSDCEDPKHSFEEIKRKRGIASKDDDELAVAFVDDTLRSVGIISEYGVHRPGEFLFYRYILSDSNNAAQYTASISAPLAWGAYVMPRAFFVPENDSVDIFFGATVPDTAQQGSLLETEIVNIATGDTTLYRLSALIADTITGTISLPFTRDHHWIVASGRLAPGGTSRIDASYIDVADSFAISSGSADGFTLRNSIVNADSGRMLRVDLGGSQNVLENVTVRGSANGVTIAPTDLTVNNLVIAGSASAGLAINGAPVQRRPLNYITSIGSRSDGMVFASTGNDTLQLYGAVVDLAEGMDIVLNGGSSVECIDCLYNEDSVSVDAGSVLRRLATVSVAVNDTAAIPMPNATVVIANDAGTEVYRGRTDEQGFIPPQRLLLSEWIGSAAGANYTTQGPYTISVLTDGERIDTTVNLVAYRQLIFWVTPTVSSVPITGTGAGGYHLSPLPLRNGDVLVIRRGDGRAPIESVEIVDLLGELIVMERFQAMDNVRIALGDVASGTYFAVITERSGGRRAVPFTVW